MFVKQSVRVALLICAFSLQLPAAVSYDSIYWAPPLDVQGTRIVNAKGFVVQLKGFATMDPTVVTHDEIIHFKNDWNITVLRIPLIVGRCWTVGTISINESYLAAADSVLKWCRDNKIYVLFDGWHEGGTGATTSEWSSTVAAWRILVDRYKNQDHLLWEIFNEPHNVTWETWVPMAEQLIDTIRSRNPLVTAVVAATVNWCQNADVRTLKIDRAKVIYSWHPYTNVYGSDGSVIWEENFGFIQTMGFAPIMATEWGFTSSQDSAIYGTQLIQYLKDKGASWTGWCYSKSWAPQMLLSENPEKRNPAGNLMYKAYHDTVPVISAGDIKYPVTGSISKQSISINNSAVFFNCAEASPVMLSIYTPNGRLVKVVLNQTLPKGPHSIRWDGASNSGTKVVPGLYTVLLKIKGNDYHMVMTQK